MDLTTNYLGFKLKSPIVPSAGPLTSEISNLKEMEDAGAGAAVLYSLFEEQIEHDELELDHHTSVPTESYAEATSYLPEHFEFRRGPKDYLEHIRKAKDAVDIPIIASLNGNLIGGWIEYAKLIEEAGADALELNIYLVAADINKRSEEVEKNYSHIVRRVRAEIKIPIAVKMHPFFSSTAFMAKELSDAGANGLVLFNRFYQPDINLETLEIEPDVLLSTPMEMRLPLRWIAILHDRIKADLAATTGVYTAEDVVKMILVGANVTQMFSALVKHGIGHIADVITNVKQWLEENEYESLDQMRGSMSYKNVSDPAKFERANYMKVLHSFK
jgi:dihydroorotate dehydrogenase (fumarate)